MLSMFVGFKSFDVLVCTHCKCNLCWKVHLPLTHSLLICIRCFTCFGIDILGCSILLRSREWEKIKGNAPWLLDAVVCVLLDLFVTFFSSLLVVFHDYCDSSNLVLNVSRPDSCQIILQFAYYKSVQKGESDEEIKQPII